MIAPDLLQEVVAGLEAAGIPFMLTGSVAAAVHGAGRSTMDVDLIVDATRDQLRRLVESLARPGIYVSSEAALEAFANESMFNVIDTASGWKVDVIIRKSRPFSETEFARRLPVALDGRTLWVATVEDMIIAKLEWAKLGNSARQIEDVSALLRVAGGAVDRQYLDRWIVELDLGAQWLAAHD